MTSSNMIPKIVLSSSPRFYAAMALMRSIAVYALYVDFSSVFFKYNHAAHLDSFVQVFPAEE